MKWKTLLLAPLAVSASVIPNGKNGQKRLNFGWFDNLQFIERRQLGALLGGMGAYLPTQKSFKIETDFQPSIKREGVKRLRLWYGPYKIKGLNVS
jgi:hypothetical protein